MDAGHRQQVHFYANRVTRIDLREQVCACRAL
jgi:hypothetical protein